MKKSIKLSIAMALMMGATAGINAVAPSTASAEISDKFRMELNGVTSYVYNKDYLGGYSKNDANGNKLSSGNWSNYTRVVLTYYADKNITLHTRLHSGYEEVGNYYSNGKVGSDGHAYFDQSWIDFKDKKANVTYSIGKLGAVLGQSMVYNSTGNHTGGKISIGNWYDPQSLQIWYVNKKNGQKMFAVQASKELFKNFQMTATYLKHTAASAKSYTNYYTTTEGKRVTTKTEISNANKYSEVQDWDVGFKYKMPGITLVAEYAQNIAPSERVYYKARSTDKRAYFIELYTGPTNDMTSQLPLQKPGTSVWSLKYQDIGSNAVGDHNTTFYNDARGWRLNYGHTFRKGLAGDIAISRMQDKGGDSSYDPANGKWKTAIVAELAYKFR